MPRPQPPAGFITIGPGVYISLAPVSTAALQPNDPAPNIILIFGWMGALTRHLQHYSRKYVELYPHATQIIVKCGPSFFLASERGKQNLLLPVVEALKTLGCLPSINNTIQAPTCVRPRVLVHSFSNGGGYQLTSLARLLSSKYPSIPPSELPVSALILDSSPCVGSFRTVGLAFSIAIRNPVARYIALPIIYFMHALRLSLHVVFGGETMEAKYLKMLLQPRLLPWMNAQTLRLYIYSKKDELVPWQEVQRHAGAARKSGLNVRCEVYEESAHVAHMRLDPKRYWASILDLWQVACSESQAKVIEAGLDTGTDAGDGYPP